MGGSEIIKTKNEPFVPRIIWPIAIELSFLHLMAIYGWYLVFVEAPFVTFIYGFCLGVYIGLSVTIGAHRLWAHRSFKAKLPLRFILLAGQTLSGQYCLWTWVRYHRLHHKYSDTDADPHNSKKGFFFSHIGWMMLQKHPQVVSKRRMIDMSDIEADPWIMFQKRHYEILTFIFTILIPVAIPCYFWKETIWNSFFVCFAARYVTGLNATWCVNSIAHLFGTRPYDKRICPVESSWVSFFGMGEGWHNYHHTFPWDCHASEFGKHFNLSSRILTLMERWGLAYDLKAAGKQMMINRITKHGDGTHPVF